MKTCSKCGETKPVDGFYVARSRRDGRDIWCKPCRAAAGRARYAENREKRIAQVVAWQAANPARVAAHQRSATLRKYGLTQEQWDEMLAAQGGRCAICRTDEPGGHGTWHTDHDHACCAGQRSCGACVRGLLCNACNLGIGYLQDSPDILRAAIRYLTPKETPAS